MSGVLPDEIIYNELIGRGFIKSDYRIKEDQVQPSSFELTLGEEVYLVPGEPDPEIPIERLKKEKIEPSHDGWFRLEPGNAYIVEIRERIENLYKFDKFGDLYLYANPKSSAGRTGLLTKVLAPGSKNLDEISPDYNGKLYSLIIPRVFPVKVTSGISINQVRIFSGEPSESIINAKDIYEKLESKEIYLMTDRNGEPLKVKDILFDKGGMGMTILLDESIYGRSAYVSKKIVTEAVKLQKGANKLTTFFEDDHTEHDVFKMEKDRFYIAVTGERVMIPSIQVLKEGGYKSPFVAEMIPYYVEGGEFRSHGAGFIEYGFGDRNNHSPLIMEIVPHVNRIVQDGSTGCLLVFYRLHQMPQNVYKGSYNNQGLTPGKYFK